MSAETVFATAEATAEIITREPTLNDAVQGIIERPEETLSGIGKFFSDTLDGIIRAIPTIIFAVIVLIVGLILTKLSVKLISKGLDRSRLDDTVTKFVSQIVKIVLYVILLTVVLSMLGIPSTSIITVIGTAGVAIGLALQDSLSNVAGGFLLMISKPFKIGDYISAGGAEGTVEQISIMHTRLVSFTNQVIYLPNGQAVNAVITNNSAKDIRRVDLTFSLANTTDFPRAQKAALDCMSKIETVLKEPAPEVRIHEGGNGSIVVVVRPWCRKEDYWEVWFDVTEQVREAFIAEGIAVSREQMDVRVTKVKE